MVVAQLWCPTASEPPLPVKSTLGYVCVWVGLVVMEGLGPGTLAYAASNPGPLGVHSLLPGRVRGAGGCAGPGGE